MYWTAPCLCAILSGVSEGGRDAEMDRWVVVYAKPRKEPQVRDRLQARGLRVYLPLMPRRSETSRGSAALFPRYLFVGLDPQIAPLDEIRWMPGLVGLVSFDGQPATVDDSVIAHIETRLRELRDQSSSPFRPGQRVRLAAGHPLAPLDAIFEKPCSDRKRAYALIEMLGRLTRCQVEMQNLEAVDPLA